jgi:hypothetical protein
LDLPTIAAPRRQIAQDIAARLAAAADRLHDARELGEFIAALEAHRQAWQSISLAAPKLGWMIPEQLVEFSLTSAGRADGHLNDHEIEALIRVNRFASSALIKACAEPTAGGEA